MLLHNGAQLIVEKALDQWVVLFYLIIIKFSNNNKCDLGLILFKQPNCKKAIEDIGMLTRCLLILKTYSFLSMILVFNVS